MDTVHGGRAACEARDAQDMLGHYRERFSLPDGLIYLDGNSLGALPRAVGERVRQVVGEEWGRGLIRSWNDAGWIGAPERVGAKIARLIGAAAAEVVVCDSTTVNLFKALVSACRLRTSRHVVVCARGEFPTNLYIGWGAAELMHVEQRCVDPAEIMSAMEEAGPELAAVMLTHVNYRSGRMHDMAAITAAAHRLGALTVWDLSHSTGVMPVALNACHADFAVGCTYKYLNGGPGAPAYVYVAARHLADVHQPLTGWLGHARPFDFAHDYEAAPGIARMLVGTPPILSLTALESALDVYDDADMQAVRAKSEALTGLFITLVGQELGAFGFGLGSPAEAASRGGHVSLTHEHGYPIMQALAARGVIGDFRAPNLLRFGFSPLYVRSVDVWDAVVAMRAVMESGEWDTPGFRARKTVT